MRQISPNQKHAICGKNTLFFFRVCGYMCVCVQCSRPTNVRYVLVIWWVYGGNDNTPTATG